MSNPWVSVSKRMPEKIGVYQCYTNDGYIITCTVNAVGWWTLVIAGQYYGDLWGDALEKKLHPRREITHWRELPKPPQKAAEKVKFYK